MLGENFGFRRFESVESILRGFCMLPLDFYIDRTRLLLLYDCLKSERSVVKMCAEVCADVEDVVRLCNEFNLFRNGLVWQKLKRLNCRSLLIMWDGNGDDYMCTFCYLFTYFLLYAYTFLIIYLLLWQK